MRAERRALGREPDRLAAALEPILQQLERRRPSMPTHSTRGRASAREGAQLVRGADASGPVPCPAKRTASSMTSSRSRRDLAEELEREVQALVVDPADRPVAFPQPSEQRDDLPPRLVDDRDAGEQPHQRGEARSASSPPRR